MKLWKERRRVSHEQPERTNGRVYGHTLPTLSGKAWLFSVEAGTVGGCLNFIKPISQEITREPT